MSTKMSSETLIGRACSRLLVGGVLAAACLAWPSASRAANPRSTLLRDDGSLSADGMVHEALIAELQGRNRDRDRWIQEALKDSPDHRAARWLDGQVLVNRRWVKIDEIARASGSATTTTRSICAFAPSTPTPWRTNSDLAIGVRNGSSRSRPAHTSRA